MTPALTSLDSLRARLTDPQRAMLDDVWLHMKETHLGLPERALLDKYSREVLTDETSALGGSVIYSGYRENKLRYNLALMGVFLTSDGPRLESLMKRYLEVLKSRFLSDRDIERFSSKDLSTWAPVFSASELNELRMILSLSYGSFASRIGGRTAEEWFVSVDDDVVDLKHVNDWDRYIKTEIMKRYDAKEPVGEADRVRYHHVPGPRIPSAANLEQIQAQLGERVGALDLGFIQDNTLRQILELDWKEIAQLIEIKAWKSCIIMCGGILEGLLLWKLERAQEASLDSSNADPRQIVDYEEYGLFKLLRACKDQDLLAEEAALLTDWTRLYRNIVHPGNQRRESREVGKEHATIAINVVRIVAKGFRT